MEGAHGMHSEMVLPPVQLKAPGQARSTGLHVMIHRFLNRALNTRTSTSYTIVWLVAFMLLGGFISALLATLAAFIISATLNFFVLNPPQSKPKNAAVIITGCSTGIGQMAAARFAELGYTVFASVLHENDSLSLLTTAKDHVTNIIPFVMDVTKEDAIQRSAVFIRDQASTKGLTLLGLVNNAGFSQPGLLETMDKVKLMKQYEVNVIGTVSVTNAFLPLLREFSPQKLKILTSLKPKVIMMSSGLGKFSPPCASVYASSKHALEAITDGYRVELKELGIQVVSIQPGRVQSQYRSTLLSNFTDPSEIKDRIEVKDYYSMANDQFFKEGIRGRGGEVAPEVVGDVLSQILLSPNPNRHYITGPENHLLLMLLPWLPPKFLDFPLGYFFTPLEKVMLKRVADEQAKKAKKAEQKETVQSFSPPQQDKQKFVTGVDEVKKAHLD